MKKIMVGLSGGVDSAVTALLLKKQGYEVTGVFMQNWEVDNQDPYCTAEKDLLDAKAAADKIGIPLLTVNFAHEYWHQVFQHCLDEFAAGRTPNPDVLCNREIKFKALLDYALEQGADMLATGHYARVRRSENGYELLRGIDSTKDQSYFLYLLNQHALSHALFPLGELKKTDVRQIAHEASLPNAHKKDSTGICFIGERKFSDFLKEFMLATPGDIKTEDGKIIGKHTGLMFYTLGQRKGLMIGGLQDSSEQAWYVIDKDLKNNVLIVGQGHDHPRLQSTTLKGEQLHWQAKQLPVLPYQCVARTRYHQPDHSCTLESTDGDKFFVRFDKPLRAITPGQSVVFYKDEICLGGGIII